MINSGIYSTKNIDLNLLIYVESLTLFCAFCVFKLLIIMILLLIKAFG